MRSPISRSVTPPLLEGVYRFYREPQVNRHGHVRVRAHLAADDLDSTQVLGGGGRQNARYTQGVYRSYRDPQINRHGHVRVRTHLAADDLGSTQLLGGGGRQSDRYPSHAPALECCATCRQCLGKLHRGQTVRARGLISPGSIRGDILQGDTSAFVQSSMPNFRTGSDVRAPFSKVMPRGPTVFVSSCRGRLMSQPHRTHPPPAHAPAASLCGSAPRRSRQGCRWRR